MTQGYTLINTLAGHPVSFIWRRFGCFLLKELCWQMQV